MLYIWWLLSILCRATDNGLSNALSMAKNVTTAISRCSNIFSRFFIKNDVSLIGQNEIRTSNYLFLYFIKIYMYARVVRENIQRYIKNNAIIIICIQFGCWDLYDMVIFRSLWVSFGDTSEHQHFFWRNVVSSRPSLFQKILHDIITSTGYVPWPEFLHVQIEFIWCSNVA